MNKVFLTLLGFVPALLNSAFLNISPTLAESANPSKELEKTDRSEFVELPQRVYPKRIRVTGSKQVKRFYVEEEEATLGQVTSVSQLSDVQPNDWAFQALQSLVERYGCIEGYPNLTYRGNRAITRYEFAAGLNACLDRINELIASSGANLREDIATLQRLQQEFAAELATLGKRVDDLEARTAVLEDNQFSTTTKLSGDAYLVISDVFGDGVGDRNNTVLQYRGRLLFDTSFMGKDRLRAILQAGDTKIFFQPGNEARLAGELDSNNDIAIDTLSYVFPASKNLTVGVFGNKAGMDTLVFGNTITPFDVAGVRGSFTRFGQRPPIYRTASASAGASFNILFTDNLSVQLGYSAGEPNNPTSGNGLFNGNYGAIGQLTAKNLFDNKLDLALTYVNSYTGITRTATGITAGLRTGTGSRLAAVDARRPTSTNSYGVEANFKVSKKFQIGGWAGYSAVRAIELGDADVWNYGVTLAFPDLGKEGNLGGILFGVQPHLTDTTPGLGRVLGRRSDPDTGFHIEAFYRIGLNSKIDITPGILWLTAPNHDNNNPDIIFAVLRTTFKF